MKIKISILILLCSIFFSNAQNGEIKNYYDSGELEEVITYLNGKEHGSFKTYYKNGQLSELGTMKNDELDGKYISYTEDGLFEEEFTFKDGIEHGPYKTYYKNGQVSEIGTMKDGIEYGPFKTYWETGELHEEGTLIAFKDEDGYYDDPILNGKYDVYLPNGKLIQSLTYGVDEYNDEILIGEGFRINYFESEDLENLKIRDIEYLLDGELHGKYTTYHENGKINGVGEFFKGEEVGIHKEYYSNGQLSISTSYKEGNAIGPEEHYHRNGNPKKKGNNGLTSSGLGPYYSSVGVWTYWDYYDNGQLERKYNKDEYGDYEGYYIEYTENGDLHAEGYYVNDEQDGKWFDSQDGISYNVVYDDGNVISSERADMVVFQFTNKCSKKVQILLRYKDDENDGDWTTRAWYQLESNDTALLGETKNKIYYYFAETIEGDRSIVWKGSDSSTYRDGKTYNLRKRTANSFGKHTTKLTCD